MKAKTANKSHLSKKNLKVDAAIGANLRFHREAADVTQQELADALGISFQQIQKYEKGITRIACSTLLLIANFLNISLLSFFNDLDIDKGRRKIVLNKDDLEIALLYKSFNTPAKRTVKKFLKDISKN